MLSLYKKIYLIARIPNNKLILQFVRGLVLQSWGVKMDWANFAACTEAHREQIRSTKLANKKGDGDEGSDVQEGLVG
jgi:hypothetical protein